MYFLLRLSSVIASLREVVVWFRFMRNGNSSSSSLHAELSCGVFHLHSALSTSSSAVVTDSHRLDGTARRRMVFRPRDWLSLTYCWAVTPLSIASRLQCDWRFSHYAAKQRRTARLCLKAPKCVHYVVRLCVPSASERAGIKPTTRPEICMHQCFVKFDCSTIQRGSRVIQFQTTAKIQSSKPFI